MALASDGLLEVRPNVSHLVPVGQEFRVVENDGFEYVQEKEEIDWLTA